MNKTIIVKIGTESLMNFHSSEKVEKMVRDIARLMREKIQVVLVSSGAVGCGREMLPGETNKQVLASVGQPILMQLYAEKFAHYNITTAQVLPTHATLEELQSHREQFVLTLNSIVRGGILPIINENDPLSTIEMRELGRGADNDQNALLVGRLLNATDIILVTNTNGVYLDRNDKSTRIKILKSDTITDAWVGDICGEKSTQGTGGMQSKLQIGREFSHIGGVTHICDGVTSGIFEHTGRGKNCEGTQIIP